MNTLKTQTRHTNKSSVGEVADVRCTGFVVRSRLIFSIKDCFAFWLSSSSESNSGGPVSLRIVFLGLGLFRMGRGLLFPPTSSFLEGGKPFFCLSDTRSSWKDKKCVQGNRLDIYSGLSSEDENTTNDKLWLPCKAIDNDVTWLFVFSYVISK